MWALSRLRSRRAALSIGGIYGVTGAVASSLVADVLKDSEIEPRPWLKAGPSPFIDFIVLARNEAANIQPLPATPLDKEYPRDSYRVTVVDDGSTGSTAARAYTLAARYPHLRVLATPPVPQGWAGKNYAPWAGACNASPHAGQLLFEDADTRHHPLMLASVVRHAEDHPSLLTTCRPYLLAGVSHSGKKVLATILAACALVTGLPGR